MSSVIDDIKARLDLVELIQSYIRLQKAGVNYRANCPFHNERTPSFVVSPTRQIWHCFGCSKGGDHFKFVMEIEGLDFPDALELLAKRAGVQLRREDPRLRSERTRLYNLVEEAAKIYEAVLHSSPSPETRISPPLAYLKNRGLADETVKNFRLGYAPDSWDFLTSRLRAKGYKNEEIEKAGLAVKSEQGSYYDRFRNRITFPIADASGRTVGFSGRIFDNSQLPAASRQQPTGSHSQPVASSQKQTAAPAKYINTPQTPVYDKSRVLYGFDKAKEEIRRQNAVVLVEGQMDVVMSHQAGVKNAVAVSGTALSSQQLQTIKRLANSIISSFDRDAAGEKATKRSLDLAASFDFERKAAMLPQGFKDPAEIVEKDPALWQKAVDQAQPIVQFYLDSALARHDRATGQGKRSIAEEVLPEIKVIQSEVEKTHWLQALAKEINIPEEVLWQELKKVRPAANDIILPEASRSASPKTRRQQLEALLIGTLIRYPAHTPALTGFSSYVFIEDSNRKIFETLAKLADPNPSYEAFLAILPDELREPCNHLAFQAEVILERIDNAKERANEVTVFARELEREWTRERLRVISTDIAEAEKRHDEERLARLLSEFQSVSAKTQ